MNSNPKEQNIVGGLGAILGTGIKGFNSASRQALQRLLMLRLLVTLISIVAAGIFHAYSPLIIPIALLSGVVIAVVVSIAHGLWRLHRYAYITQLELFLQLLVDVIFVVVILLYTGGVSNPLISYFLVLLAIAATMLRKNYVNGFSLLCIALYTGFLAMQLQVEQNDHGMGDFQLHLVGMWVTFVVSALLITLFLTRMAEAIRARELTLARARENEMRNEQLIAIGTLAAGTAHALGTPLSTMSVLLTELDQMDEQELAQPGIKEDISLLRQQVVRCKDSLNQLTAFYNRKERADPESLTLGTLMDIVKDYIINIHPNAKVSFILDSDHRQTPISPDLSLRHAIINLVENAIKASKNKVSVTSTLKPQSALPVEISVQDDGPGIPVAVMENMGEPFISTRKDSMGLGIFLANAAIQRNGGKIEMFNLKSGGALSVIKLPISKRKQL
ncbi:MAG: ATP-binding protein [Pseudohongiellaceae bacterium]|nr:ATP-binding protein [Pseudohongiellaceae bacterium]